tara:strand:- start:1501 stop:1962 length:462 start_codon:yes stop_codon:yes gene_type:complete
MANAHKISLVATLALMMPGCAALDVLKLPLTATAGLFSSLVPSGGEKKDAKADKKKTEEESEPQKLVGTVRFSYEDFVLIYSPTNASVPPGTPLTTVNKEGIPQSVKLKMSAERKGSFLVADVVKGNPKSGHLVVTDPKAASASQQSEYQVLD